MRISDVIKDTRNDAEQMVRISQREAFDSTDPLEEIAWEGRLENIPSEFWERKCQIGWSAGKNVAVITIEK